METYVRWQVSHGQRHAEPKGHNTRRAQHRGLGETMPACTATDEHCWLAGDWGPWYNVQVLLSLPSDSHSFVNSIGMDRRGRRQRRNGLNNKQIVERAKREGW